MAGPTEPEDQLAAEWRPRAPSCRYQSRKCRSRGRAPLVLCALLVVAASGAAAWWLGAVPAVAVYLAGTLALVVALLGVARRPDRR